MSTSSINSAKVVRGVSFELTITRVTTLPLIHVELPLLNLEEGGGVEPLPFPIPLGSNQIASHLAAPSYKLVRIVGFEPTTTQFQTEYSTKLSYILINTHKKAPNESRLFCIQFYLTVHKQASE
jgi:hypothetical protein